MPVPSVTAEQAGVYRQLTHRVRVNHGKGKGTTLSERPQNRAGRFLDAADPTMLTLAEGDQVDVPFLLRIGAIEPKAKPAKERPKAKPRTGRKSRAKAAQVAEPSPPDTVAATAEPESEDVASE